MSDNLFCAGQQRVTNAYRDGYTRTFTGHPEMNDGIKNMLHAWVNDRKYSSVLLFFTEKCGFDEDYSGFLLRELLDGRI